ncbi:F5/8 type C domain-containing protein [Roseimicrobium gellanilyticum]|uniref:F5/8 type C domain-containing protein n=1 Tax=Roseimicrobium gellanilyticum TaxID=748857 RepID=A0A366HTS8_9BACT|nr:discoidin domain-containing protein [Roseimicrobium gellanilyticum]RBP47693.1 F5/8 type C domain-containing protein [Roseimicrobium gellanilyticum]
MPEHPFFSLFDDAGSWQVVASGQARGELSTPRTEQGATVLRLDYDFHGGGGFVVLRRTFSFSLPTTFDIGFRLRGSGPPNHFEFKVAADGGANVWRHLRQDFALPSQWTDYRFNEREFPFAWGPAGGGAPSNVEAIEIAIAAGPGGKGTLELSCPSMTDQTLLAPKSIRASSHLPGHAPDNIWDADAQAIWRAGTEDKEPWCRIDFGKPVRFGGLVLSWPDSLPPRAYRVEVSTDGESWTSIYRATSGLGARSFISMPGSEASQLRLIFKDSACAALQSVSLRPDAFSRTPNEFVHHVAAECPRGMFPRYWYREQSYWTPIGSPEGRRRALVNEEGMVETDEAGFSLEPFILTQDGMLSWADADTSLSMAADGVPVPAVAWSAREMRLEIQPWVDGHRETLTLHVTYRLQCPAAEPGTRLVVAVRPFQVNPPWQAFRNLGGMSPIYEIDCTGGDMRVDGRPLNCTPHPTEMGAASFEEGGVTSFLQAGVVPPRRLACDEGGHIGGAMVWDFPTGGTVLEATVSFPYFDKANPAGTDAYARAVEDWRQTLGKVTWQAPENTRMVFDCFRTAAGHILINRDGPAIQPGPRRYTRSWVRDCVIMGAALAKAGLPQALRVFLEWYAPFQREDGFVPCVVDRDGVDWLVEHDSHGQFLWGLREDFRNAADPGFLQRMLPHIRKAADYLITIRSERQTTQYKSGDLAACYGLLPESASHEGYLAHPVHSYWDDFWGVRGLEAAADLAEQAGQPADATRWRHEAAAFQEDIAHSLQKVIAEKSLAYIPGSVEWADFDPTATSNAIAMLDFADALPREPLHAMLDTYIDGFHRKHRGEMPWNNYTAYEIRIIGAFVRLGRRDEANELLTFFLSDRRPLEWNQWPEITWRDPRSPGHLGDVPHTWIAAEYLLAVASMVASEREATASLVLAAGMPWAWISQEDGFAVQGLPTRFGDLAFCIATRNDDAIYVEIRGSLTMPPGGLFIAPPLPIGKQIIASVTADGAKQPYESGATIVRVTALPFVAELQLGSSTVLA